MAHVGAPAARTASELALGKISVTCSPATGDILPRMTQMTTDAAVLAKEAANFEGIAGELQSVIARVESMAAQLDSHWQGTAAKAAQAAITRFHEAAAAQLRQLNDISTNIHAAGAHYSATDDDQAGALASAMGLSINGRAGSNGQGGAIGQQGAQVHPQVASAVVRPAPCGAAR